MKKNIVLALLLCIALLAGCRQVGPQPLPATPSGVQSTNHPTDSSAPTSTTAQPTQSTSPAEYLKGLESYYGTWHVDKLLVASRVVIADAIKDMFKDEELVISSDGVTFNGVQYDADDSMDVNYDDLAVTCNMYGKTLSEICGDKYDSNGNYIPQTSEPTITAYSFWERSTESRKFNEYGVLISPVPDPKPTGDLMNPNQRKGFVLLLCADGSLAMWICEPWDTDGIYGLVRGAA